MRRGSKRRRRNPDAADRALTRIGVPQRHRTIAKVAAGLLVLGVAAYFSPNVYDRLTYGAKVDKSNAPKGSIVETPPVTLAASAGVPVETYSLARTIASEAGLKLANAAERQAVGWVVINHARELGKSITDTVTAGKGAGFYGHQNIGGRFVSTAIAPRTADLELADDLLSGRLPDNTAGATHFFNPGLQDYLWKRATGNYRKSAQDVFDSWIADGYTPMDVEGVNPAKFVVFTKAGISGIDMIASFGDVAGLLGLG